MVAVLWKRAITIERIASLSIIYNLGRLRGKGELPKAGGEGNRTMGLKGWHKRLSLWSKSSFFPHISYLGRLRDERVKKDGIRDKGQRSRVASFYFISFS